ncbi:MAG: biopolymer transporter ExbD [Planctomycetes bacterium]|nr:biopolymer transporter ExbD [Planctomycetota bacterium]MCB9885147.1 biopolymer transporter ExbD [Planctomycetota bacterium]
MRHDGGEEERDEGINLMPLIDVVFLLLIFFLAATTFAREEVELDLRLPEAKSGTASAPAKPLVVNLLADGRISVDGRDVTMEALRQKLAAAGGRNQDQSVLVRGDRDAQFGIGLQVLDACRLAKITKVDFAALPASKN